MATRPSFPSFSFVFFGHIFLAFTCVAFVMPSVSFAQEAKTRAAITSLRSGPGGGKVAQLMPGAKVSQSGKQRGAWVEVNLTGWVKKTDLASTKPKSVDNDRQARVQRALEALNKVSIELVGHEIIEGNRDILGIPQKVVVKLKVKNVRKLRIAAWRGKLEVTTPSGAEIIKMAVTHDDANLAPGEEGSVSFYWEKGEQIYEDLRAYKDKELSFTLSKVKVIQ